MCIRDSPYITHKLEDKNRYQTVYAKNNGSAAAPTAGLHFTRELLEQIQAMGVNIAHVTLHVGLGTFRPVKVDDVESHHMHSEFYIVEEDQAKLINDTKKNGGRAVSYTHLDVYKRQPVPRLRSSQCFPRHF